MATISSPALTATICNLEHMAWRALCTSGSALLPLLSTTQPVMIFPGNLLLTADTTPSLYSMLQDKSFKPWSGYKLSHDEVVPLGSDAALIYYRVEAEREDTVFKAICSSCWVREGAGTATGVEGQGQGVGEADGRGWRMVSHQQTLI